ncbi:MAG: polysaccharide biosynthesis/export family protein [Pseudomonadota bacterium]
MIKADIQSRVKVLFLGMMVVTSSLFASCVSAQPSKSESATKAQANAASVGADLEGYLLGPGDSVRVRVFQEPDLSDEYSVGPNGEIAMPLAGRIQAAGGTTSELAKRISRALAEGYLDDANVAVEIVGFRPFYIFGEVETPGDYPYAAGMNIIKAIATAGGYTYRAKKSVVYIQRGGVGDEEKAKVSAQTKILPGDVVRIPERFF